MRYTTTVVERQVVAGVTIDPKGGEIDARQFNDLRADTYGRSLLVAGKLKVEGDTSTYPKYEEFLKSLETGRPRRRVIA